MTTISPNRTTKNPLFVLVWILAMNQ